MIFLSKNGQDEYINMLANGCQRPITNSENFDYDQTDEPVVLRGILNKVLKKCVRDQRKFYYVDSGYFGNNVCPTNPLGNKLWHRIVPDDLQHGNIRSCPTDRFNRLGIGLDARRHGSRIIVAAPDDKPCKFYGIDKQRWIDNTVETIGKLTDRPIVIRQRAARREDRVRLDPLAQVLADDVHALVTYNSVAATEAIIMGVPAFALAPSNAAAPVANITLDSIENPFWPSDDQRYVWACHLAYGQFHVSELKSGTALRILQEYDV